MATSASAELSIALSPQVVEHQVVGGHSVSGVISFENRGTEALAVTVELSDFTIGVDGKVTELAPGTMASSAAPYLKISPSRLDVAAGERVYFRYSVAAPEVFTHVRSMVFFVSRPLRMPTSRAAAVFVPRLGVPVYVENRRAAAAALVVTDTRAERDAGDPSVVHVSLTARNDGQVLIRPSVTADVKPPGNPAQTAELNEGGSPVLPGSTRTFEKNLTAVGGGESAVTLRLGTSVRTTFSRVVALPAAVPSLPLSR